MEKETKRCPYCGEEIMATAKKCKHCGEWLTEESHAPKKETKACPVCGEQIDIDATVCPHCHEAVGATAAAAPRTPQPAPRQAPQPARQQPRRLSDYMPYADRASDEQQADTGKAGMLQYYLVDTFFKHYADFRGAIGRKKFWMRYLFYRLAYCGVFGLDMLLGPHTSFLLTLLFSLGLIVPVLALMTRRLHDIGKSGGWIFISLVPFVGGIWLLLLLAREGRTQSRSVRARGTDWIFIAAAALLFIVGFVVMAGKAQKQQDAMQDFLTGTYPTDSTDTDKTKTAGEAYFYDENSPYADLLFDIGNVNFVFGRVGDIADGNNAKLSGTIKPDADGVIPQWDINGDGVANETLHFAQGWPHPIDISLTYSSNYEFDLIGNLPWNEMGDNYKYGFLAEQYIQCSVVDLNADGTNEILVTVGDKSTETITSIFRFNGKMLEYVDWISGQRRMVLNPENNHIIVPVGSQGYYDEYAFDGEKIEQINTL